MVILEVFTVLIGASLGSFLNVCAYRMPLSMSVVHGRSFCPACRRQLRWFELVPIISFLSSRGKCRRCGSAVSASDFLVELAAAAIPLVLLQCCGCSLLLLETTAFLYTMILVALVDWRTLRIPNSIIVAGFLSLLAVRALLSPESILISLRDMVFAFSLPLLIAWLAKLWLRKEALGMGDVKLCALIGFSVGCIPFLFVFWFSAVLALVHAIIRRWRESSKSDDRLPFGTWLAAASTLLVLATTFGWIVPLNLVGVYVALI